MDMTIAVVDDDDDIRQSLGSLFRSVGVTVELFSCAHELLASCDIDRMGCLILDVRMPWMSGLMLQDELVARGIDVPIIFLSGHADLPTVVSAMKNGAYDFFLKPFSNQALVDAVQRALEQARKRHARNARAAEIRARYAQLTAREREILEYLGSRRSAKVIAHEMRLQRKTVDTHLAAIRRKMRAACNAELMLMLQDHPLEPVAPSAYVSV